MPEWHDKAFVFNNLRWKCVGSSLLSVHVFRVFPGRYSWCEIVVSDMKITRERISNPLKPLYSWPVMVWNECKCQIVSLRKLQKQPCTAPDSRRRIAYRLVHQLLLYLNKTQCFKFCICPPPSFHCQCRGRGSPKLSDCWTSTSNGICWILNSSGKFHQC